MSLRSAAAGAQERMTAARRTAAAMTAWAIPALCLGGCAQQSSALRGVYGPADFRRTVLQSDRPVLVEFYKDNCPTCVLQEDALTELRILYGERVDFARFKIREATMAVSAPEIMDRYKLFWVPTVILFFRGQERQRWVFNHPATDFCAALNEAIADSQRRRQPEWLGSVTVLPPSPSSGGSGALCRPGQGCPIVRAP